MDKDLLKKIVVQIKKYKLTNYFDTKEGFINWFKSLSKKELDNFLSLDVDVNEVEEIQINDLLINKDLLKCSDYIDRVKAILTLKNGEGCYHLYDYLCNPIFLNSKDFYSDIEMISKATTSRYGLWLINDPVFINSPYHTEDMKLVVESEGIVATALAELAANPASIKSKYHEEDMKFVSTLPSNKVQSINSYPRDCANMLAHNIDSLNDNYHLENMKILANSDYASKYLYKIMTDPNIINGKYYREEVEALNNAKSKNKALGIYYYIANPERKFRSDYDSQYDSQYDYSNVRISEFELISPKNEEDYLEGLLSINEADEDFCLHYVALLMNKEFINSVYKEFDLDLIKNIHNRKILLDLYSLMIDINSVNSLYHENDALIISKENDDEKRNLLMKKATEDLNLYNINHEFDMNYISSLDMKNMDRNIYTEIAYYLFNKDGINDLKHIEKLNKLSEGIMVRRTEDLTDFFDNIEEYDSIDELDHKNSKSILVRLFNKHKK